MSYDHLNIGQLLFLLPNAELKQRVQTLERFYKRYITAKTGIIFNKTHIYIYIYIPLFCSHRVLMVDIFITFRVHQVQIKKVPLNGNKKKWGGVPGCPEG